ncbi:hypothetical protein HPB52_022406 [Rhipicephalus sanguineus]|uniref:PEP-utilising enzyme mobile domain-containing protein n=1 Tax=Rhipicephalus sanguineus TaxID=34632 RepID=A0A9D4Q3C7_RHISA|nr:hypothetical protein HPB52_022406 [Rhipicephalus sanguineus]
MATGLQNEFAQCLELQNHFHRSCLHEGLTAHRSFARDHVDQSALDAEVFSELCQILRGAEAESATVPRMIQELGRALRESPEKEKFLNMATESSAVRVVHQLRLLCHQLSQRMVKEGRLPSPELLFFLTYEEIGVLLKTRSPELVLKAQRRQKIHAEADKCQYASIFVGIPKPIERTKRHVEGDFEIKGAVVAREYGLPCVVGVEGITSMLNSGDYIQLDGNSGLIGRIRAPGTEDDGGGF